MESVVDIERKAAAVRALTERQIDAAVMMRRDPQNWILVMVPGTKRCLYQRVRRYGT